MKYFGMVGFVDNTAEPIPGICNEVIVEKPLYGDFLRRSIRNEQSTQTTNDGLTLNYSLSLIADAYALEHCYDIKYVTHNGVKWKVTSVEPNRPRLILQFGGVYREDET